MSQACTFSTLMTQNCLSQRVKRTQSLGTWSALGASDWLPISVEMFRPIANRHVSESRPNRPIPNSYSFSHFLDLPFINYQIRNKNPPVFCFKRPFLSSHSHFQEIEPGWLTRSSDTTLSQLWKETISFFKTRLSLPRSLKDRRRWPGWTSYQSVFILWP